MGLFDRLRSAVASQPQSEDVVGTIVEGPRPEAENGPVPTVVFQLDSQPGTEFRQVLGPLSPVRHRGDQVRVHFHRDTRGRAMVDWVEKA
jgi:hypothetical protein